MTKFLVKYTKTRNGAIIYVRDIEALSKSEAADEFYLTFPKYHIIRILEVLK